MDQSAAYLEHINWFFLVLGVVFEGRIMPPTWGFTVTRKEEQTKLKVYIMKDQFVPRSKYTISLYPLCNDFICLKRTPMGPGGCKKKP